MKLSLSPLGAIYINYRRRYTDILLGAHAQIREAQAALIPQKITLLKRYYSTFVQLNIQSVRSNYT